MTAANGVNVRFDVVAEKNGVLSVYDAKNGPSAGFTKNQSTRGGYASVETWWNFLLPERQKCWPGWTHLGADAREHCRLRGLSSLLSGRKDLRMTNLKTESLKACDVALRLYGFSKRRGVFLQRGASLGPSLRAAQRMGWKRRSAF